MESTHECSKEFLLNGTDTTTIVYNISGINREYVAKGSKGPALFYKFTWGEIEKVSFFYLCVVKNYWYSVQQVLYNLKLRFT